MHYCTMLQELKERIALGSVEIFSFLNMILNDFSLLCCFNFNHDVLSYFRLYYIRFKEVKILWGPDNPNTLLKRTLSLAFSCEYIYVNIFFWYLLLCFRKNKSSHRRYSVKKDVLKNFANFIGKHLCCNLFLIKLLLKRDSNINVFLWNLQNF